MRILLAEDDTLLGDGLRAGLRQLGFQVDWVRDGEAAERELRAQPYAAAVLDLGLPKRDGLDAVSYTHLYAEQDGNIPLEAVERVRAALPAAQVLVYPGATHGFNCWARASYHAPSAALSHGRALQFLAETLF